MKRSALAAAALLTLFGIARSGLAADDELVPEARQTISTYRRIDPGMGDFFRRSAGYVVFPGIGKGGYIVGGAHGTGVLFENGVPAGKVTLNQVTVGAQIGGQEFSEIIFLEMPRTLAEFKQGKVNLSAQASAVALDQGAAAVAKFRNGVAVFTHMKGGLMAEASVGGQQFKYEPFTTAR
ncbi:MAG TPA: lipid-binding SYLF domain-containing protein [Polyangia bacterium]|nr:lipid-binding SYLF domain-containing protein [Polyangia bacterium]